MEISESDRQDIFKRLGAIESSLATLVERSSHHGQREAECRKELLERLDDHDEVLRGNGKIGLIAQVAALERDAIERAKDRDSLRRWLYGLAAMIVGQLLLKIPDFIAMLHRVRGTTP